MQEVIKKIEQWAEDRNLIKGCEPVDQAMKLISEFGELADAIAKDSVHDIKDGIGDVFVVLTIMCRQIGEEITLDYDEINWLYGDKKLVNSLTRDIYNFSDDASCDAHFFNANALDNILGGLDFLAEGCGFTLQECVEHAYSEIKDRKGIMHNGTFIKESDTRYKDLVGEK